jgi:hypothetical protein
MLITDESGFSAIGERVANVEALDARCSADFARLTSVTLVADAEHLQFLDLLS